MFQRFDDTGSKAESPARLARLRAELSQLGLDGFVLPRTDAFQSEYLAASEERLAWLTGFTGSAGAAVILAERAALFVDGRYTVQAAAQVDGDLIELVHSTDTPPSDWIAAAAPKGARIGYDPWLHTPDGVKRLAAGAERAGATLIALDANPVNAIWDDRPAAPAGPIEPHPFRYSGEESAAKLIRLRAALAADGDGAIVLTLGDSIAWLFNLRGSDVAHTPVALAYAIVEADRAALFCDPAKIGPEVADWLGPSVLARPLDEFGVALDDLAGGAAPVRVDPTSAAQAIFARLAAAGAKVHDAADPVQGFKARKNATEVAGARAAHARDAVALCRFLAWLDRSAPSGDVDEIGAVEALEASRRQNEQMREISFETIAGAGPNGAIVHYRVTRSSNRRLKAGELFLINSGAQYPDGTTDVTRTVAIGAPSEEMRRLFTLVLKGHIAVASARFPSGTTGAQLDPLARADLWRAGHDYDHGTGHGVGSYLSVHEGPQRISKRGGDIALEPGMIVSNEPGVYREGAFGIRIENLLLVVGPHPVEDGVRDMLGFETLTLAPIDGRLVDPQLLSFAERAWLNAYHASVRAVVGPHLSPPDREWLAEATRPV